MVRSWGRLEVGSAPSSDLVRRWGKTCGQKMGHNIYRVEQFSHHITLYTATNIAFNALQALIFISTVLTNNIQSNYNVDSKMKYSNYMKIQFKALIYFELEQTLNYNFELDPN